MTKAVFLDRDGVLNFENVGYTYKPENFKILPDVRESLKILQDNGFLLIVVTNQSGIAKKIYSHQDVILLNKILKDYLLEKGIILTNIYYCPHHPDYSKCLCRKPLSMMFEKAIARYNINVNKSFCIGDSKRDIFAAESVGTFGILIERNSSLLTSVNKILELDKNGCNIKQRTKVR